MKKTLFTILFLVFAVTSVDLGQQNLKWSAEVRSRTEFDQKVFNSDVNPYYFTSLRSRLGLSFAPAQDVELFFQVQDSRLMGENGTTIGNGTGQNFDFHQAYFKVDNLFNSQLSLKAGRMKAAYGSERVVGNTDWDYIARAFDGVLVSYNGTFKLDVFGFKEDEDGNAGNVGDQDIFGAFAEFNLNPTTSLQPFVLVKKLAHTGTNATYNLGTYLKGSFEGGFSYEADAVYQMGNAGFAAGNEIDRAAYLIAANVTYKFAGSEYNPFLNVGVDMLSGDDPDSDENETFVEMYPTNHKFYGLYDYVFNPTYGLLDIHATLGVNPSAKFGAEATFHIFKSGQDVTVGTDETKEYGSELDLILDYNYSNNVKFQAGFTFFMPGDIAAVDGDTGKFFYLMATVNL